MYLFRDFHSGNPFPMVAVIDVTTEDEEVPVLLEEKLKNFLSQEVSVNCSLCHRAKKSCMTEKTGDLTFVQIKRSNGQKKNKVKLIFSAQVKCCILHYRKYSMRSFFL